MSKCRKTEERLTPFVDEVLPAHQRAEVQQHLDACPPCRVSAEEEQGARTVLRECADQLRATPVPPALRTRCTALARQHCRASASSWRSRLIPAVLAAALVMFTGVAVLMLATQRSNTLLAAQLTTDHDRCFRTMPTTRGLDAAVEEARLADEYGWDVHIPPSSPEHGVTLVGARRCLYANGRVPHLLYDAGGSELSLYVLEGVHRQPGDVTALGHRARIWSSGPTTFVLIAPTESGDLAAAVAYVRQEAR